MIVVQRFAVVVNVMMVLAPRRLPGGQAQVGDNASNAVSSVLLRQLGTLAAELEALSTAGRLEAGGGSAAAADPAAADPAAAEPDGHTPRAVLFAVSVHNSVLLAPCLRPTLEVLARQPNLGMQAVECAARIFLALPPPAVGGAEADILPAARLGAVTLLSVLYPLCTLGTVPPGSGGDGPARSEWGPAALALLRTVPHLAATLHAMVLPADGLHAAQLC